MALVYMLCFIKHASLLVVFAQFPLKLYCTLGDGPQHMLLHCYATHANVLHPLACLTSSRLSMLHNSSHVGMQLQQ